MQHAPQLTPLAFLRKRFIPIAAASCVVMLAALAVVFSRPSVYRSWGTLLVEGRFAQTDLLRTSATGLLLEQLNSVQQTVLNRSSLLALIKDFDLYPEIRDRLSEDELMERIRQDIVVDITKSSEDELPSFNRMPMDTVTVHLEYQSVIPQTATAVAIVLVNRFIEESSRRREAKTQETYLFLQNQVRQSRIEVEGVEQEIARYKKEHFRSLPELMDMNLLAMDRIQKQMDATQMELTLAKERILFLDGQMAVQEPLRHTVTVEGQKVLSLEEQVRQMRNQLLALRAVQSDKHPDVIRLARRLEAIEEVISSRDQLRDVSSRLREREGNLAELLKKFSPLHPDVIALEKEVELLSQEAELLSTQNATTREAAEKSPDNPAYINLSTQLAQARLEIEAKQKMLDDLTSKYTEFRQRIEDTPGVEQGFIDLQRRYDTLKAGLRDLSTRMQSAKEAMDIEARELGEKITVLEMPVIPERPFKPNRALLLLLSLFLAGGAGLITGFVVESLDPTVHGPQEAALVTGLPLLGVFPSLATADERTIGFKRRRAALVLGLGALLLTLGIWSLFDPLCSLCASVSEFFSGLF
jgi:uncharacterized protein involved in exopolysaccharide biosynthesis